MGKPGAAGSVVDYHVGVRHSVAQRYLPFSHFLMLAWCAFYFVGDGLLQEPSQCPIDSPRPPPGVHPESVLVTRCEEGHSSCCCKDAAGFISALASREFDWMVTLDDDAFVRVPEFEQAVMSLDPHIPAEYGIPGCGQCPGNVVKGMGQKPGMCGGGGTFMSRATVERMVGKDVDEFTNVYMATCQPVNGFSDVTTACMAQRTGVELLPMKGMNGWPEAWKTQDALVKNKNDINVKITIWATTNPRHIRHFDQPLVGGNGWSFKLWTSPLSNS